MRLIIFVRPFCLFDVNPWKELEVVDNNLDAMLKNGFARKLANQYLSNLEREKKSNAKVQFIDPDLLEWAHANGFYGETAVALQLNEQNKDDYLSDYDYCRVWPLNDWERFWINDKLTFAYMFAGTEFEKYIPESYYYRDQNRLLPLINSHMDKSLDGFVSLLREKGEFAAKPCNGGWGMGFHKLSFVDGFYQIDNKPVDEEKLKGFVWDNRNYLYTEFLHPAEEWVKISPVIHTIRILMLNEDGVSPTSVASYIRFAVSDDSGLSKDDDSKSNFNLPREPGLRLFNVPFDFKTGTYGKGTGKSSILLSYNHGRSDVDAHPDSGVVIDGALKDWPALEKMLKDMAIRLAPVEWLGYDLCITDKGPKLMEINSHSGCTYLQMFTPYRRHDVLSSYFERKLKAIDELGPDQILARNAIAR